RDQRVQPHAVARGSAGQRPRQHVHRQPDDVQHAGRYLRPDSEHPRAARDSARVEVLLVSYRVGWWATLFAGAANRLGGVAEGENVMRTIFAVALAAIVSVPMLAQQHQADPDKSVSGGGTLPTGWKGRLDSGASSLAGVKVTPVGGGVH